MRVLCLLHLAVVLIGSGNELLNRERAFSSFRTISVLVVSWNVDAAKPDSLTDDSANLTFLYESTTPSHLS